MTHATGVLNGNWRNGDYLGFARSLPTETERVTMLDQCYTIRELVGSTTYAAIVEAGPDNNKEFCTYIQKKYNTLMSVELPDSFETSGLPEEDEAHLARYGY